MTLARLALAAIVVCSLLAFGQVQQTQKFPVIGQLASGDIPNTPSEPWRIVPGRPSDLISSSTDRIRVDQYHFDRIDRSLDRSKVDFGARRQLEAQLRAKTGALVSDPDGKPEPKEDTTCYAIRSYVVERDSSDSDSTHAAGYSTCRRASRYHFKTAEGQAVSPKR
jgi:hypothetical protein